MRTILIENKFKNRAGVHLEGGWGNGYVLLNESHPWHGLPYDDIPVHVHGGLTYSCIVSEGLIEWADNQLTKDDIGKYLIGFDTMHYGDDKFTWTKEAVQAEANRLLLQCNPNNIISDE